MINTNIITQIQGKGEAKISKKLSQQNKSIKPDINFVGTLYESIMKIEYNNIYIGVVLFTIKLLHNLSILGKEQVF